MYLPQNEANRAVEEIFNTERYSKKLEGYLKDFAMGHLTREELSLRIDILIDNANERMEERAS